MFSKVPFHLHKSETPKPTQLFLIASRLYLCANSASVWRRIKIVSPCHSSYRSNRSSKNLTIFFHNCQIILTNHIAYTQNVRIFRPMKNLNCKAERITKRRLDSDVLEIGKKKSRLGSRLKAFAKGHVKEPLPTLRDFQVLPCI